MTRATSPAPPAPVHDSRTQSSPKTSSGAAMPPPPSPAPCPASPHLTGEGPAAPWGSAGCTPAVRGGVPRCKAPRHSGSCAGRNNPCRRNCPMQPQKHTTTTPNHPIGGRVCRGLGNTPPPPAKRLFQGGSTPGCEARRERPPLPLGLTQFPCTGLIKSCGKARDRPAHQPSGSASTKPRQRPMASVTVAASLLWAAPRWSSLRSSPPGQLPGIFFPWKFNFKHPASSQLCFLAAASSSVLEDASSSCPAPARADTRASTR